MEPPANPITPFLAEQGVLVLDGGLATELEARGADIRDELWSAGVLASDPGLIRQVHLDYLAAGADCAISATYQATEEGFMAARGLDAAAARALLVRAVELAMEARERFWSEPQNRRGRRRPLVAASIGPYGAYLADGAEYTGAYDLDEAGLIDFHRRRFRLLAASGADLLACETIPSLPETRALVRLLGESPSTWAWFSFCCRDGRHLADGTPIATAAAVVEPCEQVVAVGVNCTPPRFIASLIAQLDRPSARPIVVYPNASRYDAQSKSWSAEVVGPQRLAEDAAVWWQAGARLLGGCCRTGPQHIREIRRRVALLLNAAGRGARASSRRFLPLLAAILTAAAACSSPPPPSPPSKPPPGTSSLTASTAWPGDGWRTSTPEAQGMDSEQLAAMLGTIRDRGHAVDSVLVVRNGYLVLDAYVHPFAPNRRHVVHSCTKSVISALVGIAIDQGAIEGVDQPVLDFFPDRTPAHLDASKKAMTLRHVLTMTTGWECRDSYRYDWRGMRAMLATRDWVGHVLDLPMAEPPGTRFEYCNGASFLLSAILRKTTGKTALAYARQHLFGPLGISDVEWPANPRGITIGWGELRMRPVDMARFGYLYLHQGRWKGEQVVPAAWVRESTRKHVAATLQDGYGYQWWIDSSAGVYMALGYAGQFIFVVPDQEMVVVFTSSLSERDFYVPQRLLNTGILPAARSSAPLPENPEGQALLSSAVNELAR